MQGFLIVAIESGTAVSYLYSYSSQGEWVGKGNNFRMVPKSSKVGAFHLKGDNGFKVCWLLDVHFKKRAI